MRTSKYQNRRPHFEWHVDKFNAEVAAMAQQVPMRTAALVQQMALWLLAKARARTPVGNPSLWQNPDAAPPGYSGGNARQGWHISDADYSGESAYAVVANDVEYALRLEYGWSSQAPAGMLRPAMTELKRYARMRLKGML